MGLFRRHVPAAPNLLRYQPVTDKRSTTYAITEGQYIEHFTDGSWFNWTTGEGYDQTGAGIHAEPWWGNQ